MNVPDAEMEIERLTTRVKAAKEEAKDLRDDGDAPGAIVVLQDAVARMEKSPLAAELGADSPESEPVRRLATHLADCLGMLGGNYRRNGELERAQQAFERGRVYEQSSRLGVDSSYNLVNAMTLPLESRRGMKAADLADELRAAIGAIERQVKGNRRKDRWAWADLALCRLLLGQRDEALRNYERARDLGDEETILSIVAVLERLHTAVRQSDPGTAAYLSEAITLLRS
jgi:tetratricopeptide (TPR) repeat protein